MESHPQQRDIPRSWRSRTLRNGLHRCEQCSRTYTRKDHLVRHLESHTSRRPFVCSHCGKGFARSDLLSRHRSIHKILHPGPAFGSPSFASRVTKACAPCAAGKAKCDDEKPCRRCLKRGLICSPSSNRDPGMEPSGLACNVNSQLPVMPEYDATTLGELLDHENGFTFSSSISNDEDIQSAMIDLESRNGQDTGAILSSRKQIGDNYVDEQIPVTGSSTDTFSDLIMADSLTVQPPNDGWEALISAGRIQQARQAFQKLPWRASSFNPSSHINFDNLEGNFGHLPVGADHYVVPLFDIQMREALLAECVTVAMRWGWADISQSLRDGFPSLSLLDNLVNRFFKQHNRKIDPWIHAPTFRPSLSNLELTATILAASAVSSPDVALRQVGTMILKLLRARILEKIEDQRDSGIELQLIQAFLIQLETHLWHGNHLGSQCARTFAELIPLATQTQLHGRITESFTRSFFIPDENDLPRQWSLWITSESYKRLMTRFCIYDNQLSMTSGARTSMTISEYHLPFPQPKELWLAQSPWEWKQIYISTFSGHVPLIKNILPSMTVTVETECFLDRDIALKLIFHVLGGLIIDQRDSLNSFSAAAPMTQEVTEPTSAQIRRSELKNAINNFQAVFSKKYCPSNIGSFIVSYLIMTLQASIKDIEILAGKNGEQESRQMYQTMKDWPGTREAREAIWHAGQTLRLFKVLEKITSFQVVIAYHAGLVLFAYSVLSCVRRPRLDHIGFGFPALLINGKAFEEGERFIGEGSAEPMLLGDFHGIHRASTSLLDTKNVVTIVSEIILNRTSTCEWLSSHIVDGLVKLLVDLGSAVDVFDEDIRSGHDLEPGLSLARPWP